MTWLWRCVLSRVESSRVGSGPRVKEGWASVREAGKRARARGVSYAEKRVMSEMEVRISESDTASP